jgi:DNA-binding NarL/FixJ family response regulator
MLSIRVAILCRDVIGTQDIIQVLGDSAIDVLSLRVRAIFGRSTFDILILDSRIPDAMALCCRFRNEERPRVIFVAAPEDRAWGIRALSAGAMGIVYLTAPTADVTRAVEAVHKGQVWAPRDLVVAAWMTHLKAAPPSKPDIKTVFDQQLSSREREVFRQAAVGLGNKELADRLDISQATVKVHLTHIFQKLGLRHRAELAAVYHGIFVPAAEPTREPLRHPA